MAQQHENEDDHQNHADRAGRAVTPSGAVRPARKGAEQDQDEDDEKNGTRTYLKIADCCRSDNNVE
jgi:hypothetical protein